MDRDIGPPQTQRANLCRFEDCLILTGPLTHVFAGAVLPVCEVERGAERYAQNY